MYRRILRTLRASLGQVFVLVGAMNYFRLTMLLCICQHVGYHVVTSAYTDQSKLTRDVTADDATAVTSGATFMTSSSSHNFAHIVSDTDSENEQSHSSSTAEELLHNSRTTSKSVIFSKDSNHVFYTKDVEGLDLQQIPLDLTSLNSKPGRGRGKDAPSGSEQQEWNNRHSAFLQPKPRPVSDKGVLIKTKSKPLPQISVHNSGHTPSHTPPTTITAESRDNTKDESTQDGNSPRESSSTVSTQSETENMLENQSQSNQPSEDNPKAFKSQSIRNQLRTGKAVGGELYAEMSSGTANELQFRTKSLGKSVDPQPNNFQTTPASDQSVNKDAGMPGSFPQSKMGEANDELNVLGRSTPTSGFHDAPRAAFGSGSKTDKSFTLEGARLVSVTFVDPRTYSVDPSDEYLPVRSKREAGVSNNAIPEDSATAEPSSDLSADDNVLEDFPSEPQYNKGTTSESKYEQDVTDDDVTIEMTSRSAAKVDPVSGGFGVGRSIDNTQHTTDAAVRYNIKRDLSAPTTSSDSPSNPDFLDTVVDNNNNNNNNNNSNNNNNGLDPADNPDSVNIGVILPFSGSFPWVIQQAHPALKLAVDLIVRKQILPKKKINLVLRDSHCSETYGPLQGIDLYVEKAAHVFVGPACDYAVAPLARFSFRWQIPILTAGALVSAFADRREYRLLTRVQGAYAKAGRFVLTVFERFGWRWAGMIFHDNKNSPNHGRSNFYFIAEAIFLTLRTAYGVEPWHSEYNAYNTTPEEYADILRDMSRKSRVVVLCAAPDSVREIMIKAHELNFDNGEYVFFNIDLFSSKNDSQRPWFRKDESAERNAKARKAYEALMTVTLRKPTSPEYRQFSNDVKKRARTMYPNFTYGEEEVNSFVGAFHDAVLLYALALNETLSNNGSISDGAAITRRMWNRTFEGITGNVSIDENGDRNADYSLLDLNPTTGEFEVVANYYGNKKRYEPVPGKSIHWAGGRTDAPPDTPECGFDGSKCPPDEPFPEYGIVIIVLGSILLIVIIAVFVIYRHIKLEAELAQMNWRVRWEDILFGSPEKNKKLERQGSKLSLVKRGSCTSSVSGDTLAFQLSDAGNRQLFTKTGYYKGAIIAIKSIPRTNITISKPLLLEIKRMKDLQNDHIVRFIGACIDYPNQGLLTEYCPKGSLQDVLENDQIKLDWMFRYSIMQDIVRGMAYLHGTDLRSHGNLKSTNCVVDSRFVVKITDFGLHYFRFNPELTEEENNYSSYHKKLWTAPELLRMQCRPPEGTQKGDVYSFAIVCQEIVYRNGVFYLSNLDLSPQEIYNKVSNGLKPFFRPTLEEYDCPSDELAHVIRRCWAEDPSDRPDFTQLKTIIRKLNRDGDKGNILDNLLSRMEQYANNLEALVEERTADYLQQKKKAEDLLYNMLPRSVALQLIRGESVTAESYDSVSIYFSDICGFTAMSAESTPMQVVDLLNDLYTTFDSIIENFDVYKVETIGDAYMVVSGLPEKNGDLHAREVARMSLMLLEAVKSFKIRHRPKEQLKLRIGIHTGPVCTGVVGHKMPRYCLFGDTVNTTSRMESNGLPLRIHVSNTSKLVLDRFGTFELESRGEVAMKGKGAMHTWWLLGERPIQESPGGGGATLNIL